MKNGLKSRLYVCGTQMGHWRTHRLLFKMLHWMNPIFRIWRRRSNVWLLLLFVKTWPSLLQEVNKDWSGFTGGVFLRTLGHFIDTISIELLVFEIPGSTTDCIASSSWNFRLFCLRFLASLSLWELAIKIDLEKWNWQKEMISYLKSWEEFIYRFTY